MNTFKLAGVRVTWERLALLKAAAAAALYEAEARRRIEGLPPLDLAGRETVVRRAVERRLSVLAGWPVEISDPSWAEALHWFRDVIGGEPGGQKSGDMARPMFNRSAGGFGPR